MGKGQGRNVQYMERKNVNRRRSRWREITGEVERIGNKDSVILTLRRSGSSVGIATGCGLNGQGIESR